jgi:hypothetical protein
MKLIIFRYNNGKSTSFHLDFIIKMESGDNIINIFLTDGTEINLPLDFEEFIAKVYSNNSDYKEYETIDFDQSDPSDSPMLFD